LHLPFWLLLAGYLALRLTAFGKLLRQDAAPPLTESLLVLFGSFQLAWLSPLLLADLPAQTRFVLMAVTTLLLGGAAFLHPRSGGTADFWPFARSVAYFGIIWPLVTTAPLLGAANQRHFYLASAGIALALGTAAARALGTRPRVLASIVAGLAGLLLLSFGALLAFGVTSFARQGQLSAQLEGQLAAALERTAREPDAVVVVLPELPDNKRVFWEYALPAAAAPPFAEGSRPEQLVASFSACHCEPDEWLTTYRPGLDRLMSSAAEPVYLIEWAPEQAAFTTRALDRAAFRQAGYAAPAGPLLRPRRPELPAPAVE
jgi:hypothetical protein